MISCFRIFERVEFMVAFDFGEKHKWHKFANRGHEKLTALLTVDFYRIEFVIPFHNRKFYRSHEFANHGHKKFTGFQKWCK